MEHAYWDRLLDFPDADALRESASLRDEDPADLALEDVDFFEPVALSADFFRGAPAASDPAACFRLMTFSSLEWALDVPPFEEAGRGLFFWAGMGDSFAGAAIDKGCNNRFLSANR
jgi:hypothetical protein